MTEPLRIVFAGTPEFAAEHLKALLDSPHEIVAVYSQPDRPAGRGQKLMPSPVKQLALEHNIPVLQPQTLRDADGPSRTGRAEAGLAGGGRLRPDPAASGAGYPAPGLHQQPCLLAATLARCGADPARRRSRRCESGVTVMRMEAGLDTGPMLLKVSTPISAEDTGGSLHDRLAETRPAGRDPGHCRPGRRHAAR